MEQHLATEPDGELEQKSPDAAEAPAPIEPASLQTSQNMTPATEESAASPDVDAPSHDAASMPADPPSVAETHEASSSEEPDFAISAPLTASAEVPPVVEEPTPAASFIEESPTTTNLSPAVDEAVPAATDEASASPAPAIEPSPAQPVDAPATELSAALPNTPLHQAPATEPKPIEHPHPAPAVPTAAFLEQWQKNEPMRHIPPIAWIVAKVDGDVRKRLEMFLSIFENLPSADPRHRGAEEAMLAVCRSLDKLAEASRKTRSVLHPPSELTFRIPWSVNTAVSVLKNADANTFGRRQPFQSFDRSGAESVYAALVVVLQRIDAAATILREIDPTVDEKLYGPLVQLVEPLPTTPMA